VFLLFIYLLLFIVLVVLGFELLLLAGQARYHLSHASSLFCFFTLFFIKGLALVPQLVLYYGPPTSAP
jgi:hypothetical protein